MSCVSFCAVFACTHAIMPFSAGCTLLARAVGERLAVVTASEPREREIVLSSYNLSSQVKNYCRHSLFILPLVAYSRAFGFGVAEVLLINLKSLIMFGSLVVWGLCYGSFSV